MTKKRRIPTQISTSDTRALLYILLFGGLVVAGGGAFLFGWDSYIESVEQAAVSEAERKGCQRQDDTCPILTGVEEIDPMAREHPPTGDKESAGMTEENEDSDLVKIFKAQERMNASSLQGE